jgi:hypothetical protein
MRRRWRLRHRCWRGRLCHVIRRRRSRDSRGRLLLRCPRVRLGSVRHAGRHNGSVLLMHGRRRPCGVRVVRHAVRGAGHGSSRIMRRSLRIVGVGIRVHVAVLIVYRLIVIVMSIRMLLMRILRSPPRSIAIMLSRTRSHIYKSSASSHSTNTSWHGLPSRQMMVHLAGLGFTKQRPRPLLPRVTRR